ncbi:MAG: hypothetical protein U0746_04820 [Gemmataceae bacterium]
MPITLSPETIRRIEDAVNSGRFSSADAAVSNAFDALNDREADQRRALGRAELDPAEVRRLVAEGVAALDRGDYTEFDDASLRAFFEQIKRDGQARLGRSQAP